MQTTNLYAYRIWSMEEESYVSYNNKTIWSSQMEAKEALMKLFILSFWQDNKYELHGIKIGNIKYD